MALFGIGRKRKTVIVADDGGGLRGIVADAKQVFAANRFPVAATVGTVLDFGKKQGAGRVLFLRVSDVRELDVKLGPALDGEERRSAIEYAAETRSDDAGDAGRISYMEGVLHDFRSGVLVSMFDAAEVAADAKAAAGRKLGFLGVTNFKQLLMSEHFSDSRRHHEGFLFLLGGHGFAAIPERNRLSVRNLPFGLPEPGGDEAEYFQKLRRRLAAMKGRDVRLYSPEATPELAAKLAAALETDSVSVEPWENALNAAAAFFLEQGRRLIVPALPSPKPKDPKAPGTVIGLTVFGAAVFSICFLGVRNHITLTQLERRLAEGQAIEKKVKEEDGKLKKLQDELAAAQELNRMFVRKRHISPEFLTVLNLLSRYKLEYTKINSVEEQNRGVYLSGETAWQPDLSRFFTHFESELGKRKLALFSDGITDRKDGRIEFRSHVAPDNRQER